MDSRLTTGGAYVTAEEITSFKGYYRVSRGKDAALIRSFVQFDGEGDAANARPREIGGHPAVLLRGVCLRKNPAEPALPSERPYDGTTRITTAAIAMTSVVRTACPMCLVDVIGAARPAR